jgi:hypothetical protein
MSPTFVQLNHGWNAEPNAPNPEARPEGDDVVLQFAMNPFQFPDFREGEKGFLRFLDCTRYRLGPTNDEGWYLGQCRFSKIAPSWGEFYAIFGGPRSVEGPDDWVITKGNSGAKRTHFLFYFRDETFECAAERCIIEDISNNALIRTGMSLPGTRGLRRLEVAAQEERDRVGYAKHPQTRDEARAWELEAASLTR